MEISSLSKLVLIVSSLNTGDVGHADAVLDQLVKINPQLEVVRLDPSTSAQDIKTISANFTQPYLTYAVGEKAIDYLNEKGMPQNSFVGVGLHQKVDDLDLSKIDLLVIPETETVPGAKKILPLFSVPTKNPTPNEIRKSYEDWQGPLKPSLDNNYIIIMLPGDAPDESGRQKIFTQCSAQKLVKDVINLRSKLGDQHQIIIQNGPRTGKHNPQTLKVQSTHEIREGQDPSTAVDPISEFVVGQFNKKNIPTHFFNFVFEISPTGQKKAKSYFNQLLYVAQQANNIFILPGESVSMMGQINLYLPANRIFVFESDSMNDSHRRVYENALKRGFVSTFDKISAPKSLRESDDAIAVAKALINGFNNKFESY